MNPDLLLGVVASLTGFILKTALAFGLCLTLSWLAGSPGRRFTVWLSFLCGTAAYWLWLAQGVLVTEQVAATAPPALVQPVTASVGVFQIPASWALPVGMAMRVLGVVYLLVLVYMLVTHIKQHLQLKWILRFTSQPPSEIAAAFRSLARSLCVRRSRLLILSGVSSPATFGWIRPTILLPDICLEQDRSDLEAILRHELEHVRRWDFVWNGLAVACRALLFFHPAAWYALKRLQFDRELACDLAAVSDSPKGRARYAETLIQFARLNSVQDSTNWGIDFAALSGHLNARVHSILAGTKKASAWLRMSRIACGLALLAAFVAVEPSMGVLLSYAQQQMVEIRTPTAKVETRIKATMPRATGGGRLLHHQIATSADAPAPGVNESAQPTDRETDGSASAQSAGPQLMHRGAATSGHGDRRQTVVLIDDASGQVSKAGGHDHNQVLQQTATAAAVLKQLSALDRH